jgi:EAL domain-containing protein (putative c-di-GMP-specific phosphodiesterase class I)
MLNTRNELPRQLNSVEHLNRVHFIYQPIFNVTLQAHTLIGYEALLRSDFFSPEEFFMRMKGNAERELHWSFTLLEVMKKLVESKSSAKVSINCEQQDVMEPWFVSAIKSALVATGANPYQIIIELTEHNGICNHLASKRNLQSVSAMGITIALDDFGIKHANLDVLCFMPIGEIKLDRKFISNIDNHRCAKSVEAIVHLAARMSIDVIAEGVETHQQSCQLLDLGINLMQGFYFSSGGRELCGKSYSEHVKSN